MHRCAECFEDNGFLFLNAYVKDGDSRDSSEVKANKHQNTHKKVVHTLKTLLHTLEEGCVSHDLMVLVYSMVANQGSNITSNHLLP